MTRLSAVSVIVRVAGLATIALLQTYWFLQPVPTPARLLAATVVAFSLARPAMGLLVFAGLAPLSTVIADLCGGGAGLGAQMLEQWALGVCAGVLLRPSSALGRTRIGAPALLVTAVAIASAIATLPAAAASVARSLWDGALLQQLAVRHNAYGSLVWAPVFAALVIAECALLAWTVERMVRREPELATRVILMFLAGHAGAAMVNFLTLFGGALRTGEILSALPDLLTRVRYSRQMDWNAAASAFLLAGVAGIGLMRGPWSRRVGAGTLVAIVALGVWITGSRIAIAMSAGAIAVMAGWQLRRASNRVRLTVAGVAVALILGGWMLVTKSTGRNDPVLHSVKYRSVMFAAGIQLFREAPVFGIGLAKFHGASESIVGEYLRSLGAGPGENAHNNFLQVLAEQGLVGLAAFLAWLAIILVSAVRAQIAQPDFGRGALLLGILACMGTWLTGHPLLVPEFALVFWTYCGLLAAQTPAPSSTPPRTGWALLVCAILATGPVRAYAARNAAELEHLGFGVSIWHDDDSQRYREAGADFALYLPANGRPVELPFRLAPGAPASLSLEIRIDGALADRIPLADPGWHVAVLSVPRGSRKFELVEFAVKPAAAGVEPPRVVLRVGKPVLR